MKNAFFTLTAILCLSTVCFAQQTSALTAVLKICRGKIESISVANPKNRAPAEITVLDENGQEIKFAVKSDTIIYDKDDKKPVLSKIEKEEKVIVEYITSRGGINIAKSIKSVVN